MQKFNGRTAFCVHLVQLSKCDSLGRFCADMHSSKRFDNLVEELKNDEGKLFKLYARRQGKEDD
jgi:hypothetical protein